MFKIIEKNENEIRDEWVKASFPKGHIILFCNVFDDDMSQEEYLEKIEEFYKKIEFDKIPNFAFDYLVYLFDDENEAREVFNHVPGKPGFWIPVYLYENGEMVSYNY